MKLFEVYSRRSSQQDFQNSWEWLPEKVLPALYRVAKIPEEGKYDCILETFAEKLVKERAATASPGIKVATSNGGFLHTDPQAPSTAVPPWLASSSMGTFVRPPSPSVTLSLSPSTITPTPPIPWLQTDRLSDNSRPSHGLSNLPCLGIAPLSGENPLLVELMECCRDLEEGHHAWAAHKKEAAWRLKRVELQLESEKACRRREKMEDIEAKVKALKEEQKAALDRIEAEYREQLAELRREAEVKEQKLAKHWATKHSHLANFIKQKGCRSIATEPTGQ